MRLTSKGRYAVTAMLDVALHAESRAPLADISERQGISFVPSGTTVCPSAQAWSVSSVRGPWWRLSPRSGPWRDPVGQVITAVDESVDATRARARLPRWYPVPDPPCGGI